MEILHEYDPKTKEYSGYSIQRIIKYLLPFKINNIKSDGKFHNFDCASLTFGENNIEFYEPEEIDQFGLILISFDGC